MEFVVAEKSSDVTKSYLKKSLEYQYRGKNYKFSDDLITILLSDFKRKVKNLDWLFQGKTRVSLRPSAEITFKALSSNKHAQDFIQLVRAVGGVVEPEQFVAGYVTINKQQLRLSKAKEYVFRSETLTEVSISGGLKETYISREITPREHKYLPDLKAGPTKKLQEVGEVFVDAKGMFVNIHPMSLIRSCWINSGNIDTSDIMDSMNSSDVIISIDINDYITCSEGGVSSCMSMNSSYHLGWMMHYRSDFSIMTFTHKKGDTFYKTGRSWTFVKLTEDGLPYARPFYKLSKIYMALNSGHVGAVDSYIQTQAKDVLKLPTPKMHNSLEATEYGKIKHIASPNMRSTTGNAQGTGYFDWVLNESCPIWEYKGEYPVIPFSATNYQKGPICLLNFPDALDVNGEPTNEGHFNNTPKHNQSAFFGWNERIKQFITTVQGERILLRDALELQDGTYISQEYAKTLLSGDFSAPEVIEVVEEKAPEISLEDIDVDNF